MTDDRLLDRLDDFAAAGEFEAVEDLALREIPRAADASDLWRYVAWARFEVGRFEESLSAARNAGDPLYEAKALFHLWRFQDAADALTRCGGDAEDEADAEWYRGLLEEFRGGDAARHFRRAAKLAPYLFQEPVRLSDAEIDAVVREATAALPPPVAHAVEETAIDVLPLPRPHPDVDPLTLGLYIGQDLLSRSVESSGELPPKIEIYRRNIERIARDRAEAVEELRITLLHEIGHHLGMDEKQVEDLGLA